MSVMDYEPPTMTRGDLKPDIDVVLGDASSAANFSAVTPEQVTVIGVMNGVVVVDDVVDEVFPAEDGKTMRVVRAWEPDEVDDSGRMWVVFRVDWPGEKPQTFPEDTPLMLYFRQAPGDA